MTLELPVFAVHQRFSEAHFKGHLQSTENNVAVSMLFVVGPDGHIPG